jgi:UDP-glucose 6-dehydrogenase
VQAALLTDAGHDVYCVDTDETRIENLKKDVVPIFEPSINSIVEKNHVEGLLISPRMQYLALSLANYNLLPWALPQMKTVQLVQPILNTF